MFHVFFANLETLLEAVYIYLYEVAHELAHLC